MCRPCTAALLVLVVSCGGSGGGTTGTYTSVSDAEITLDLKSGGKFTMSAGQLGSQEGTWRADGQKIVLSVNGQEHTMVLDGSCMEDAIGLFGRMCKGGKAGEAGNVPTAAPPPSTGSWVATNTDGTFKLDFGSGNSVTMTATPAGGGAADSRPGTYSVEGNKVYVTLTGGEPMVLQWINGAYESTAFGLMMKFVNSGKTERRKDGKTEGRKSGRTEGRKGRRGEPMSLRLSPCPAEQANGQGHTAAFRSGSGFHPGG